MYSCKELDPRRRHCMHALCIFECFSRKSKKYTHYCRDVNLIEYSNIRIPIWRDILRIPFYAYYKYGYNLVHLITRYEAHTYKEYSDVCMYVGRVIIIKLRYFVRVDHNNPMDSTTVIASSTVR